MTPLPLVKAFISHSTKNKIYANSLKKAFIKYGIDAFVSGEDIKGGQPWQKRIRKEIHDMDIFIVIHTQAFSDSMYCVQESGMALERENEVEIIPINSNMKKRPESFLTNFQYIDRKSKTTEKIVKEILETLKDSEKTKDLYFERIEPKVNQVAKDAKKTIDDARSKSINSIKTKTDRHIPSATATRLSIGETVRLSLAGKAVIGASRGLSDAGMAASVAASLPFSGATAIAASLADAGLDLADAFNPHPALTSLGLATAGLATDGLATDGLVSRYASDLCPNSALVLATRNLASRCVPDNSYYYRGKSNQPRLPVTYPDELI